MKVELRGDVWKSLFPYAFTLMEEARKHGGIEPFWTFGGGTVLMLRYRHPFSRDIDIFVPDPQHLGFVTPRLSEAAENISSDYVEQGNFVKLVLDAGEVDVVASPNLTDEPFEIWEIMGRPVKVETAAEIVAKKLYHRGTGPRHGISSTSASWSNSQRRWYTLRRFCFGTPPHSSARSKPAHQSCASRLPGYSASASTGASTTVSRWWEIF